MRKPSKAEIEAAARAIHALEYDVEHYPFDRETEFSQQGYRESAKAAIEAAERVRTSPPPQEQDRDRS